mmetsp:Transcript_5564/g.16606  ORF Transcript_5564/g.16606 Transcript_5564/m.16606 type:complete len:200 (-) Transcript_5564:955-1554(-)
MLGKSGSGPLPKHVEGGRDTISFTHGHRLCRSFEVVRYLFYCARLRNFLVAFLDLWNPFASPASAECAPLFGRDAAPLRRFRAEPAPLSGPLLSDACTSSALLASPSTLATSRPPAALLSESPETSAASPSPSSAPSPCDPSAGLSTDFDWPRRFFFSSSFRRTFSSCSLRLLSFSCLLHSCISCRDCTSSSLLWMKAW